MLTDRNDLDDQLFAQCAAFLRQTPQQAESYVHLKLDEDILWLIDAEYDILAQNAEANTIEKARKKSDGWNPSLTRKKLSPLCARI
jgi:hypothetical protein